MQKEKVIVNKPSDKGGGIIITDFSKYKESCLNHLNSKTETNLPYYKQIKMSEIKPMIKAIDKNLVEALATEIITEDEAKAIVVRSLSPNIYLCMLIRTRCL